MKKIKLLIVDDHAILREGLRALLSYFEDIEIVGEAANGEEAIELVKSLQPDIVLMDIIMPGMNGFEATRIIHEQFPQSRVLVLTQHEEWQYVMPLLKAGAAGFILKKAVGADLISAIRTIAKGESFLYPPVAKTVLDQIQGSPTASDKQHKELTFREREVLAHILRGETNRQIAYALGLSIKTVEWHRSNLMEKLGARSLADLVKFALKYEQELWLNLNFHSE
ncbi:MAG: DNA-binding response regulator, LuxR family [Anaerolineae bacterium]|nr:MAG: DNA-binding response regulator, LuxR family [Anaerolineae bacterium]